MMRRSLVIASAAAVAVAAGAAAATQMGGPDRVMARCDDLRLSPAVWRDASIRTPRGERSERQVLAIRIKRCGVLRGLRPRQVRHLVGRPDDKLPATRREPEEWDWFTGGDGSELTESTSMAVQFDRERRVIRVLAGS
jgi:hypothetical protein